MNELRMGRPEAAAAVWSWRPSGGEAPADRSGARTRGSVQALVGWAVAGALLWLGWRHVAAVAAVLATGIGLAALLSPDGLYVAIQRLFDATGRAVGSLLTWLLLVPVFYLFFAPFGALFRRGRRDRMRRFYEPDAASYWEPHAGLRAASDQVDRQY